MLLVLLLSLLLLLTRMAFLLLQQMDCPEDVAAYIHRVGRTARYMASGHALLLLTPSEAPAMTQQLAQAKVPVKQLRHNPARVQPVGPALQALLSKSTELKEFAQRSIIAYVRSVYLQPNKEVFKVGELPMEEFANGMGLLVAPKLRFLKRVGKKVVDEVVVGGEGGIEEGGYGEGVAAAAAAEREGVEEGGTGSDEEGEEEEGVVGAKRQRKEEQEGEEGEKEQGPTLLSDFARWQMAAVDGGEGGDEGEGEGGQKGSSKKKRKLEKGKAVAAVAAVAAGGAGEMVQQQQKQQQNGRVHTAAPAGGGGADDEDDFLVVKQHDVFETGVPAAATEWGAGDGLGAAAAAGADQREEKKKQRIKLGVVSSNRTVFDEEGQACDPLELLVTSGALG